MPGVDQISSNMIDDKSLRANTYSLLAALLSEPPSSDLVDYLRHIEPESTEETGDIGKAWQQLRSASLDTSLEQLDNEFHHLFIGLGRGEIVPFGSWHMTGFLMEKPLSDLRDELRSLGIEPGENEKDPEDHIAALCECMAILIQAGDVDESRERQFFARHIHPWANKFFGQLQSAVSAKFYIPVGFLGQSFMDLESQYLNVQTH
jgi:TorA maturation chaperone TorD